MFVASVKTDLLKCHPVHFVVHCKRDGIYSLSSALRHLCEIRIQLDMFLHAAQEIQSVFEIWTVVRDF